MSTIAAPDRSPATSSRSAAALNLIGGTWVEGRGNASRDIYNPADTAEMLSPVREASPEQVDEACAAAARAFPGWRATPTPDRAHVLFRFRELLEKNFSDVSHSIVRENGKLLSEARAALRRGIDVVDFACGIPSQMMGQTLSDVSRDVDCLTVREPMGVVVGIPPFNFPALIPLWMMSVAVACGNAFILKPAEKAPLTGTGLVEMFADAGLPPGVVGVVQGSKDVSETAHRQPACPGGLLRRHVGRGGVGLPHRGGPRQARPGPRRGEEPSADPARCRPGTDPARPDRIVLRLCGAAMPCWERAGGGRRSGATGRRRRRLRLALRANSSWETAWTPTRRSAP